MTTTTKIMIILVLLLLVAPLMFFLFVWYAKKKVTQSMNYAGDLLGMAGEMAKDEVQSIIASPFRPDDIEPHEEKEYNETFATEAVKNLLDPREWYNNISYWWS